MMKNNTGNDNTFLATRTDTEQIKPKNLFIALAEIEHFSLVERKTYNQSKEFLTSVGGFLHRHGGKGVVDKGDDFGNNGPHNVYGTKPSYNVRRKLRSHEDRHDIDAFYVHDFYARQRHPHVCRIFGIICRDAHPGGDEKAVGRNFDGEILFSVH